MAVPLTSEALDSGRLLGHPFVMVTDRKQPECWLTDMDGVLVHEDHALPGAARFIARLVERDRRFLVLTNNSVFTARDLAARLAKSGLLVPEEAIWTSALATPNSSGRKTQKAPHS